MKLEKREVALNVLVVFLSIFIFLAFAEGVTRLTVQEDDTRIKTKFCQGPEDRMRFHKFWGWTEHPNAVYLERKSLKDDWSLHRYNSQGFRDTFDSGDNRTIFVLGDSFARGTLVGQNQTFTSLLERETPNVSFKNYGVEAYSTANEFMVYRNVSGEPHAVVVLAYYLGNDALDNVDGHPSRPQFRISDGELEMQSLPANVSNQGGVLIRNPAIQRIDGAFYSSSALYRFLRPKLLITVKKLLPGVKRPTGAELSSQLNLTKAMVQEISNLSRESDVEMLVMVIPESGEVNPRKPNRFSPEKGQPYWDAQRQVLKEVAESRDNVEVLYTRPVLQEAFEAGVEVYGEKNYHLENAGHRIIAEQLYRKLASEGYLANRTINLSAAGTAVTSCP